jgi:hypothetical protein
MFPSSDVLPDVKILSHYNTREVSSHEYREETVFLFHVVNK